MITAAIIKVFDFVAFFPDSGTGVPADLSGAGDVG